MTFIHISTILTEKKKHLRLFVKGGEEQLQKTEKLMVISVDQFTLADKTTGEDVKKYKYVFMDQNDQIRKGYSDKEIVKFTEAVSGKGTFDNSVALPVKFLGRVWDDKITWKLDPEQ